MIAINFAAALLSSFAFLHPNSAKLAEPVLFEDDIVKAFTNSCDEIASLVTREIPPPHMMATYRKLGVKVYARYRYHKGVEPEFVRRAVGFIPFSQDADGVWLEDFDKYPPEWKAAVAAAKADVAAAEKLKAIGGNKVGWWFSVVDFSRIDCDVLRAKCIEYAAKGDIPGTLPVQPCLEDPDYCDLPTQNIVMTFTNCADFVKTRLELKTKDKKTVFYDLLIDARPAYPEPRAPSLVTDKMWVTVGFRLRPCYERGYGILHQRVIFDPQYRTFSPSYPKPHFRVDLKMVDGRREVRLSASVKEKLPVQAKKPDIFEMDASSGLNELEDFDL